MRMHNPAHPGRLIQDYLDRAEISVTTLAKHLDITRVTLSRIIHGKSAVTAEMALRLERVLNINAETWLAMQANYDLWQAEQKQDTTLLHLTPVFA
ncbi:transcriptional regulator [Pasteurellaceae bacterium Macca]|nr:transcriptional regulator [Pasteurellaceae bacterium Macca]MCK3656154.1 transcriptional regulator [Pasteurellaceae bacterium Macca]MCK3656252.1 transcriptional regulator [Pasteurellaceae bacterium Macca]MCK3656513.1 transcriptional regulator [Pasteurellaceae bacterium Macca]MCK3657135.1 transcriptional regulator [Pasteurellaceae bacterium Macca]